MLHRSICFKCDPQPIYLHFVCMSLLLDPFLMRLLLVRLLLLLPHLIRSSSSCCRRDCPESGCLHQLVGVRRRTFQLS